MPGQGNPANPGRSHQFAELKRRILEHYQTSIVTKAHEAHNDCLAEIIGIIDAYDKELEETE